MSYWLLYGIFGAFFLLSIISYWVFARDLADIEIIPDAGSNKGAK